jgi:hypothetical protein
MLRVFCARCRRDDWGLVSSLPFRASVSLFFFLFCFGMVVAEKEDGGWRMSVVELDIHGEQLSENGREAGKQGSRDVRSGHVQASTVLPACAGGTCIGAAGATCSAGACV